MDYTLALALSAILLTLANLSVRRPGGWTVLFVLCGLGFSLREGYFLPVGLLFGFLLLFHPLCFLRRTRRFYLLISIGIAVLILNYTHRLIRRDEAEFARLREQYPFESLQDRLPPPPNETSPSLPPDSMKRLDRLEDEMGWQRHEYRSLLLKRLHEEKIGLFLNSPGFGLGRMNGRPTEHELYLPDWEVPKPWVQASDPVSNWSTRKDWNDHHYRNVFDFLSPEGFGYFKDREHVAGFQAHRFASSPGVDSIELVGLLLHEKPVAYVSDELPRMDQLRMGPTRPLNDFESVGLAKLRKGEDLVVESMSSKMRMLGSIRSTKQCLECHGGQRGDLLGAFSYILK